LIEEAITDRTRAICVVHYAGVGCEMDTIMEIALRRNLIVVEDAAQGVFAQYKDKWLGTIGDLGSYSFHATKNITCGEGGALLINNRAHIARAEILCDKGTNRSEFFRGEARKYDWRDVGVSGPPSDLAAAALLAQLQAGERVVEKRKLLWSLYQSLLKPLEDAGVCRLPVVPDHCRSNHHIFYILTESADERSRLIAHLKSEDVTAHFHYVPLHMSEFGAGHHAERCSLPHTVAAGTRLLRLPLFFDLTESDVERIASAIFEFYRASFAESEAPRAAVR
jgi:dTDP-4-amino-4,6-dideoxygalactose transaminase